MPKNYDTRVGPGGGAQMYVDGQWLDENLFSPGTGLAGPLSPKQEANAGYAPGSAQTGRDPYLGETPDPGSNLYEPWRTPNRPPSNTVVPGASGAPKPKVAVNNQGVAAQNVKPDGYGDLANMYGQQAKQAANAGYTGVAKSVTGAQGSALAAASAQGAIKNQQTSAVLAKNRPPTQAPINKRQLSESLATGGGLAEQRQGEIRPVVSTGPTSANRGKPPYRPIRTGIPALDWAAQNLQELWVLQNTIKGTVKDIISQDVEQAKGLADTLSQPARVMMRVAPVVKQEVDKFVQDEVRSIVEDFGKMKQFEDASREEIKAAVVEKLKDYFDKPDFWKNVNMAAKDISALLKGDYKALSPEGKQILEEATKAVTEFSENSPEILQEQIYGGAGDTIGALTGAFDGGGATETNRWQALAESGQFQQGAQSGLQPDRVRDISEAAPYDPARSQLADAARQTATAMGASMSDALPDWMGEKPNIITERLAEELDWQAQGYASAADMLEQLGYLPDPENPGVWVWPENTMTVGGTGGGQSWRGYNYPPPRGDGGWHDYGYGYGHGRSYGASGYGGGRSGGGNSYGLINWRI